MLCNKILKERRGQAESGFYFVITHAYINFPDYLNHRKHFSLQHSFNVYLMRENVGYYFLKNNKGKVKHNVFRISCPDCCDSTLGTALL